MKQDMALLHIGAFSPDSAEFKSKATSVAADLIQRNLLEQLTKAGLPEPDICAYLPVPSFPADRRLFHFSRSLEGGKRSPIRTLGHINFGPLKILTLGLNAACAVFFWGIRNRKAKRRIVLTYNLTAPPVIFLLPICRMLGMELVPYVGDVYVPGETVPNSWLRRLEFKAQAWLLPKADGLLVCNQAIVDDFAPGTHGLLMDGGVPSSFVGSLREKGVRADDNFTVIFAAELDELDGIQILLDAIEELHDMPRLRIKIFGRGKLRNLVEEAAAGDSRIGYFGFVPYADLLDAYRSADLLLILRSTRLRTQRYFFPFKFIECLATGTPVLATCTGHVEKEFGSFVYLLRDESPKGLAEQIRAIAATEPNMRSELGRQARGFVEKNKTWEVQGRRVKDYLESIVKEAA